jgi:AcrR family transcriptional regulator
MAKKRAYHHGDLRRALVAEAVRIIHKQGVSALTLREVGARLGVSRTAMYRHFADKSALLTAVATEGFRMLKLQLLEAWEEHGRGHKAFNVMGHAYVRFAVTHSSHYRVMFGGFVEESADAELAAEGRAAFQALVDAIGALQSGGEVRSYDRLQLAQFIWATVHGVAMLAIDGLLGGNRSDVVALVEFSNQRIFAGISR